MLPWLWARAALPTAGLYIGFAVAHRRAAGRRTDHLHPCPRPDVDGAYVAMAAWAALG
jgi:hypothetical protein